MDLLDPDSARRRLEAKTEPNGDCLDFNGSIGKHGYGRLWDGQRVDLAHRVSYRLNVGPIPPGMVVCHHCDNRPCVKIEHLFLGWQRDNLADMTAKKRRSQGPDHSAAIRAGWTDEVRQAHSEWKAEHDKARHAREAEEAGVPVDWKRCHRCATWLPGAAFHKHSKRADGLHVYCKACRAGIYKQTGRPT